MHVGSLYYTRWLPLFLEFMKQWLPGFAEVESPISVDVIWMHHNFDGFSDETIHVADLLIRESIEITMHPNNIKEMGDLTSANPGSHCCINSRKRQPPSIIQ